MPISNAIRTLPQRITGSIGLRAEATGDRIRSVVDGALRSLEASVINKTATFSESHPRIIEALEPAICNVLRFSQNYQIAFILLLAIAADMTIVASIILTSSFLEYLALPELVIEIAISSVSFTTIAFCVLALLLTLTVPQKLVNKHLERAVEINKLTEAFLNLPPEFVAALNEWARNESQEVDSQWSDARKNIIDFYNSTYSTILSLEHYNLHSLPNVFDNPNFRNKLARLLLYDNHLARLPESIGNLHSLTHLNLADNAELTGLPPAILQLPPICTVDITNCNFSATNLARIRQITNNPDYVGPRISHSMRPSIRSSFNAFETTSIEQSLREFYRISGRNYNELPKLKEIPNLRLWLCKLTLVADFKGGSQKVFVTKIIEYLERANADSTFRDILSATISEAVNTCGDRVALSVLKLGITYKLSTTDSRDIQRLHHLLTRGVWALELLHEIARQKIPTLRMFDEIEVYLGYPIHLKEALNLPIDIGDMLYFSCSALTPKDIEIAKNSVLSTINNVEEEISFLIDQPQWCDALRLNYGEQFVGIEKKKEDALTLDDPDYTEIDRTYKEDVKELTRRALQALGF